MCNGGYLPFAVTVAIFVTVVVALLVFLPLFLYQGLNIVATSNIFFSVVVVVAAGITKDCNNFST